MFRLDRLGLIGESRRLSRKCMVQSGRLNQLMNYQNAKMKVIHGIIRNNDGSTKPVLSDAEGLTMTLLLSILNTVILSFTRLGGGVEG